MFIHLQCIDGFYYIGHTDELEKRIAEHQKSNGSMFTAKRLSVELVFFQTFATRDEALSAERQMKGWSRKKKQAMIEEKWDLLKVLSKKKFK